MKWIVIILGIVIVLILGFFAFNSFIYQQKQSNPKSIMEEKNSTQPQTAYKATPISHATMVLSLAGQTIYTDPVGGAQAFAGQPTPNIILVTDIHGDHLDPKTLMEVSKEDSVIIVPQAVKDEIKVKVPGTMVVLANGDKSEQKGINIEAIPMYNIPEGPNTPHTKGRGNGYILEGGGKRIYIAGDTGGTPEMRALKDIDVAFVPMNLPYTMSVEEAADAVLAFKPKVVAPYHYRGPDGLSDIEKFKRLVDKGDSNIKFELLDFYPGS